ncbi:MAG: ATP cone domain-containing protein [Phycisphaerae bacterium]
MLRGVKSACGKRPISEESKERVADGVEEELHKEFDREVASRVIGERVMSKLRDLDEVAYIRFASEYYKFRNVEDILQQLETLSGRIKDVKEQQKLF